MMTKIINEEFIEKIDDIRFGFTFEEIFSGLMACIIIIFIAYPLSILTDIVMSPLEIIGYVIYKKNTKDFKY